MLKKSGCIGGMRNDTDLIGNKRRAIISQRKRTCLTDIGDENDEKDGDEEVSGDKEACSFDDGPPVGPCPL